MTPLRTQLKLQPRFLTLSPIRQFHNGNLQLMLTNRETLSVAAKRPYRLQPLELNLEVGGRNNLGKIDCQSNVAGWIRSSDNAVIFVDEPPKRRN